jgi:E3 ubiquitin-protein ligase TRIP12
MPELRSGVELSNGYHLDSPQVQWLFQALMEFEEAQLGDFLQFATGGRCLPVGGFAALRLTVAKAMDKGVDALPTVMTCTKYLKLPEYPSFELLQRKLIQAIQYGRDRFEMT